jgi:hypothetical protein
MNKTQVLNYFWSYLTKKLQATTEDDQLVNEQDLNQKKTTRSKRMLKQKQDSTRMVFSTAKRNFYWVV